ncbi:MAG: hypothetical protein AAGA85_20770 [Bacteroidota bacterium]
MKHKSMILLLLAAPFFVNAMQSVFQKSYEDHLNESLTLLEQGSDLTPVAIFNSMPTTTQEAETFYALDYGDRSKTFRKLNRLIQEKALEGHVEILGRFITMSQFVDGYFAEAYFDDIEAWAMKNSEDFCRLISSLPPEQVRRLPSLQEALCL